MDTQTSAILSALRARLQEEYEAGLAGVYFLGRGIYDDVPADDTLHVLVVLRQVQQVWDEVERTADLLGELCLEYDVVVNQTFISEAEWDRRGAPLFQGLRAELVAA